MADEDKRPSLRVVDDPREPWLGPNWPITSEAVVEVFQRKHDGQFYFIDVATEFYEWTGHVWQRDERRSVNRLMAALCREIGANKKKTARSKIESANFIYGAAHRVRDEVAGSIAVFDQSPVLNTTIAGVDLSGSEWITALPRREDFCSKMTAYAAVAGPCPQWMEFLKRVTDGDGDMVDYLQRVAGYCLTPFVNEQAFFFFYGTGGNGKGTFLRVLKAVLGDYAAAASLDLFLATRFEQHTEELAALRALRLVIATETEANRNWNESKIKVLTGGDPIRARFMRQNSFEYQPQFKIIVSGNHKPTLKIADPAMRRRLHVVPFLVAIPIEQQDGTLEHRMIAAEGAQILAWALDGFNHWRAHGLAPPTKVIGATDEYFQDQDLLQQWLDARCEVAVGLGLISSTLLFHDWQGFCKAAGEDPGSQKAFVEALEGKGMVRDRSNCARGFRGITLRSKLEADLYDP